MPNIEVSELVTRIERLENLFLGGAKSPDKELGQKVFSGPTGGIRFLLSKEFFKTKKSLGEVREALARNDYQYRAAPIQTALNRLSTRTGPLAAFKEGGKKLYVKRK